MAKRHKQLNISTHGIRFQIDLILESHVHLKDCACFVLNALPALAPSQAPRSRQHTLSDAADGLHCVQPDIWHLCTSNTFEWRPPARNRGHLVLLPSAGSETR